MKCKLNPLTFQKMVTQCLQDINNEENRYHFQRPALKKLQEAAEQHIENMWNEIKDIVLDAGRREVLPGDIKEWKRVSGFNILYNRSKKRSRGSLCTILDSLPKKSKVCF